MPKLTILTACESVIVDMRSKLPSLIGIFQRMNVRVQDAPVPEKAVAPVRWAIFTLWHHSAEERGIEYTQHTKVIGPSDTLFAEAVTKFKVTEADDFQSKNHVEIFGLPVTNEGWIKIRVWLEEVEEAHGECQFFVKHIRSEGHADAPANVTEVVH